MKKDGTATQFAVLGLGRFGLSIVKTLADYDVQVLACDQNEDRLQYADGYATRLVKADMEDEGMLERLGLGNFDVVVVCMGEDFEASVIATMKLKELGTPRVIVKADGPRQKRIFESLGADLVVRPESETGAKIARRMMRPHILAAFEAEHLDVSEMHPMPEWVGKSVLELDIRKKYGITLLAIHREGETILPVAPSEILQQGDVLLTLCNSDITPE